MKKLNCYLILSFLLFGPFSRLVDGVSLSDLMGMDSNRQTLGELFGMDTDGNTFPKILKEENIGEPQFIEFFDELSEKEQMIDIALDQQHDGQQLPIEKQTKIKDKKKGVKETSNHQQQMMEKLQPQHIKAMKRNDPIMFQLIETLHFYVKEIKAAGFKSPMRINLKKMKQELFLFIQICARRQQILMPKVMKKNEKFNAFQIIAKIAKLVLKEKRQKDKQKSAKSKEEEKLWRMHSFVDSIDVTGNMLSFGSDYKKKRNSKRKKRFLGMLIGEIALFVLINFGLAYFFNYVFNRVSLLVQNYKEQNIQKKVSIEMAKQIPAHTVDEKSVGKECAICLLEIEEGELLIRTLPCSHAFHQQCVDEWIKTRNTCPSCRIPPVDVKGKNKKPTQQPSMLMESQHDTENDLLVDIFA